MLVLSSGKINQEVQFFQHTGRDLDPCNWVVMCLKKSFPRNVVETKNISKMLPNPSGTSFQKKLVNLYEYQNVSVLERYYINCIIYFVSHQLTYDKLN